jgi:putative FmdB family regulatory protein
MVRLLFTLQMLSVLVVAVWSHYLHQQERKVAVPTYDFKCKSCGSITETTNNLPIPCELCGETMIRIWTANPVHFKGTGFYKTGG